MSGATSSQTVKSTEMVEGAQRLPGVMGANQVLGQFFSWRELGGSVLSGFMV